MGEDAAREEFDEFPEAKEIDGDPLPEKCEYKDEGCDLAGSCLNCPFEECIYDRPGGKRRWLKNKRSVEMVKLFKGGKKVDELANIFGVSRRTVQRALKSAPGQKR